MVDASAVVQALVGRAARPDLLDALAADLAAPHLLDVEVLSALRGLVLGRKLASAAADVGRRAYFELSISRYDTEPLADRVWQLREQFTSYDACYLALAEALDVPLLTCDGKLAGRGHRADVRVVG